MDSHDPAQATWIELAIGRRVAVELKEVSGAVELHSAASPDGVFGVVDFHQIGLLDPTGGNSLPFAEMI